MEVEGGGPSMLWMACPDALVYDRRERVWWGIGDPPALNSLGEGGAFECDDPESVEGESRYEAMVARAVEYIRAGDVYQVNLAHRLRGRFTGSARAFWGALTEAAAPRFGAYVEADVGGRRVVLAGASPEPLLEYDPCTRGLTTRPMKGTRPFGDAHLEELEQSAKERSELAMIIDLSRNDLGRVCEIGSVRVEASRRIEAHGSGAASLLQASGVVSGRVRAGLTLADVLRATFPGGSVTGAPKIRAMQIIRELEGFPRGPYCGSAGFVSDSGHFAFNVSIRSALLTGEPGARGLDELSGSLEYCVGAGIVVESDPGREWHETIDKARVLRAALARRS